MKTNFYKTTILCFLMAVYTVTVFGQWNSQIPQTNDTVWIYENQLVDKQTAWLGGTEFFWDPAINGFNYGNSDVYCFRTNDGGTSWKSIRFPLPEDMAPYLTSIHPFDAEHAIVSIYLLATGENLIFRTRNSGESWTRIANASYTDGSSFVDAISFKDTLNGIAMGDPVSDLNSPDVYFEIYQTTDGGKSWNRIPRSNIPEPLPDEIGYNGELSRIGDHIWFGTSLGRIYSSEDGGSNWKVDVLANQENIAFLKFTDALHGVCYGGVTDQSGRLNYTDDGGKTWKDVTPAFVTADHYYWSFSLIPESYYLFLNISESIEGGPFKTYLSKDQGISWLQIGESNELSYARFISPKVGFAGEGQIKDQDHGTKLFSYVGDPLTGLFSTDKLKAEVTLSPNPVKDLLAIDIQMESSTELLFQINDANGKMIWQKKLTPTTSHLQFEYNAQGLLPGVYVISISNADGQLTKSFSKG